MTKPQLERLQALAGSGFEKLCAEFPDQRPLTGTVFLGKHYAEPSPGILMLGINPGASTYLEFDYKLHDRNYLLEGISGKRVRYWSNAKTLFSTTPELHSAMETATYAFCCPYRTLKWNGLEPARMRALMRHAKPVLKQIREDCAPRVVIVAGVAGFELFGYLTDGLELGETLSTGGDGQGAYQWRAARASVGSSSFVLAQIPHLSRAGSRKRLEECGSWLTTVVRDAVAEA